MTRPRVLFVLLIAAVGASSASATLIPRRTIATAVPVRDLALTGHSAAYVADAGPDELRCARIGLWNTATNRRFALDAKEQCLEPASTGQGVWDVSVATRRVLWITYAGGNIREWTLWTATTTRRTPRQLRFVARDVDAQAPVVIGPGTPEGIPYAVGRQIVYLGDDGRAIFRTTVDSPVRAIAAGDGGDVQVAAILATGQLVTLDRSGKAQFDQHPPNTVTALTVVPRGVAVQMGSDVSFPGGTVTLPRKATMVDVAQGRVLWTRAGDVGATTISTGRTTRLVDGTEASPAFGQLEQDGFALARGTLVRWRAGRLP